MKKIVNFANWSLGVALLGMFGGLILQKVEAWSEPPDSPPNSNVGAPLNTGEQGQMKQAKLILNMPADDGSVQTSGLLVPYGKVGLGTLFPESKLHIEESLTTDTSGYGDVTMDATIRTGAVNYDGGYGDWPAGFSVKVNDVDTNLPGGSAGIEVYSGIDGVSRATMLVNADWQGKTGKPTWGALLGVVQDRINTRGFASWIEDGLDNKVDGSHAYLSNRDSDGKLFSGKFEGDVYVRDDLGVGTRDPNEKLDVRGNIVASGTICDTNGCIGDGGGSSLWNQNGSDIYYNGGNVGIGRNNPQDELDVNGDLLLSKEDIYADTFSFGNAAKVYTGRNDGYLLLAGGNAQGDTTNGSVLALTGKNISDSFSGVQPRDDGVIAAGIKGNSNGFYVYDYNTFQWRFSVNAERTYVHDNLGVGTENPLGKLHVEEEKVTNVAGTDYTMDATIRTGAVNYTGYGDYPAGLSVKVNSISNDVPGGTAGVEVYSGKDNVSRATLLVNGDWDNNGRDTWGAILGVVKDGNNVRGLNTWIESDLGGSSKSGDAKLSYKDPSGNLYSAYFSDYVYVNDDLRVNGTVHHKGLNNYSDMRLKQSVNSIEGSSLEKLTKLRGVSFEWKDNPGEKEIGLIAQEVEKIYPELVEEDREGMKGVQYSALVAPIIEAVKELKESFSEVKDKIAIIFERQDRQADLLEQQNERIKELESKIEELKKAE
ncbi:MAG: tail fiber domain-containing protein [Candidatus Moranbacteria bacterium]|nr:tail fiber domain-containing protein [Candidatus Moranbacteria bacterium]